ncbi:hypothetical protein ACEYYB_13590 [Paracoccus sp. p4-l81]|uniref:hypothetical protein n=1 Tax=unclassified Paracoccus (in: a-proteobacteria) TaxID=2688777 RepID=UPI0035BAF933
MRAAALALALVELPAVAQAADASLLQRAADFAAICQKHLPDVKAARAAFKTAGYRYEQSEQRLHYYSADGYRVVAAISSTAADPKCVIGVSGMTPAEAESLLAPIIAASRAKPADPSGYFKADKIWKGTFNGGPMVMGVINHVELGVLRGAAIVARAGE